MKPSSTSPIRLRHGASVGVQICGALVTIGFSYFIWRKGISGFSAMVWFSFAALVIWLCLTFVDTEFESAPLRVIRRWRFLGFILVWRRQWSLEDFAGVQICYRRGAPVEDGIWMVGLVDRTGDFLAVQWFQTGDGAICLEANLYAMKLVECTGLRLVETSTPDRHFC